MNNTSRLAEVKILLVTVVALCTTAAAPFGKTDTTNQTGRAEQKSIAVEKILEKLEACGKTIKTLQADIVYKLTQTRIDALEVRTGTVYYKKTAKKTLFRISFKTHQIDEDPPEKESEDWVFDGRWLTERKQRTKFMRRMEVLPEGKSFDPMKLEGPFPMPFGQKKKDVLAKFTVSLIEPAKADPPKSSHLKLLPKPESKLAKRFKKIEMWISDETSVPVRVLCEDLSRNITEVRFEKIKLNKHIRNKVFELPPPPRDWEYRIEPYVNPSQIQ